MNNTNQSARRRFDADFAVSARIRQMRNLLGRSQMDVAAALGLTFQQLQKYEKAQNRISAGRLHQLAVEYSCPVAWFFGNYDNSGATPLTDEELDFLRLLREQTERMTQMTKTLLEMSELKTVPCTDRIELAPMVEEIFADLAPLADRNGIILESEGDGVMIGSDTLIYRMLFNLTENSIRYNRPNGTVRIMITDEKNRLVIRVTDTGCGIPENYRESIFQPFFRVDKSRSRENGGVGLGLSLVWEIVALHGGEIRVEESSERGTTIAVKLPTDMKTK